MPGLIQALQTIQRAAWGLTGLLWFLWLAVEDRSAGGPVIVAAAACLAVGLTVLRRWRLRGAGKTPAPALVHSLWGRRLDERMVWLAQSTLCGFGAGLVVGPVAALLMLVKVSLHGHPAPDFTGADLVGALMRTPAWALAGLCLGAALGLVCLALIGEAGRAGGSEGGGSVQSPSGEEW